MKDWRTQILEKNIPQTGIFKQTNSQSKMKKKLIEIPSELFEKIASLASENDRSVNKEITHLLKSAVGKK